MPERETAINFTHEWSLQEKCGVVGVSIPSASRVRQVDASLNAQIALWHRGQQGAGTAIKDAKELKIHHGTGGPEQAYPQDKVNYLREGNIPFWIVGQTRYGTSGSWDNNNLQPMVSYSPDNIPVTVAHNGQFTAIDQMKKEVGEPIPDGASDTLVFSKLLAKSKGSSWDEKIIRTLERVSGAYSLVIGVEDALFLARDPQGIRPLMLGKIEDGFIAVSETIALEKVGATPIRQIKRGEVVRIDKNGVRTIKEGLEGEGNFCDFELSYFSRPDSSYPTTTQDERDPESWKPIYKFREECGEALAKEHSIPNATFVVGVPDSGVPLALGFANSSGLPYRQLILRDHYDPNGRGRMFQTDYDKEGIQKRVLGKLSLVTAGQIWKDAIAVVCDDSHVRGDTSKALVKAIFMAGAKEVHVMSGTPQIVHPCHLGVSMRSHEELIAWRNNENPQKIAEELGATSINYISHADFIRARLKSGKDLVLPQNPKEIFLENGGCGGCLTGLHPISQEGVIYKKSEPTAVFD